ncbi:ABC transporter ATP-binding protein [Roseibium marinum]|uniref:Peptide/nickel transport system ATP-binding protein n=1 Tax=Roseibium marinum TaxID=281252 RepID=A0A2S3UKT7_9HYPH|nr:ABC transporter ATP-binding protein [Roseibium marinum]POF28316.1 peptide/nickel transport system ATP-binding protein [Roseibium marinum]
MNALVKAEGISIRSNGLDQGQALVHDLSFHIERGEVLGIVGESGSGKSLSALALVGLLDQPLQATGVLRLKGQSFQLNNASSLARLRGSDIGMIFQDPRASLNPVRTIGAHFLETLRTHRSLDRSGCREEAIGLLEEVGIGDPDKRLLQFPHHLSGGTCQRVMIALALAARPKLLIADEPTTALDTTVQAQVLDLIDRLREEEGMAVLFISHDLAVIADISDRVLVMRHGQQVETLTNEALFSAPAEDYTRSLVNLALG